jgi:hypothetical protein
MRSDRYRFDVDESDTAFSSAWELILVPISLNAVCGPSSRMCAAIIEACGQNSLQA